MTENVEIKSQLSALYKNKTTTKMVCVQMKATPFSLAFSANFSAPPLPGSSSFLYKVELNKFATLSSQKKNFLEFVIFLPPCKNIVFI